MSPPDSLAFLERYGVVALPALAVAEQLGVPLPAMPALLAVGALAAQGRVNVTLVLGTICVAALAIDFAWYELGRRRGPRVLVTLCRLSLEPGSCARHVEIIFGRYGARSMLASKFIPGLTTAMPPLAGLFKVPRVRFALYDLAGVLLWAGTWLALGYFFSNTIVSIAARATELGRMLGITVVVALGGYMLLKYARRRLFLWKFPIVHIAPEALKRRLDAGEDVMIVDLRTPCEAAASPHALPGSLRLAVEAAVEHVVERSRSREVVLYGASSDDLTSARMALQLKQKGIARVCALEGGLAAWTALSLPVETVPPQGPAPDGRSDGSQSAAA